MIASLYQFVEQMGYAHPLHPAATHIPVGCIIAAFLFLFVSRWSRKPAYFQSARHCMGLALLFLPITALLGYMDWQQNYGGAWITPIKIKLILAALLFIFLLLTVSKRSKLGRASSGHLFSYSICLAMAVGIGYLGGELVYGAPKLKVGKTLQSATVQDDASLFRENCTFCHHHDQTEKIEGPGLKGIFKRATLPTSGWALSEDNLRKQLKTPFAEMPPIEDLADQELTHLIAYLKSL